jgi:acylphosphatase
MTMPNNSNLALRVVVEGVVQGVGYREFTRRAALRLNVSGWVRNRSDGAVEALVQGSRADVDALIAELRKGPRLAVVDNVSVIEDGETPDSDGETFVVRSTA